MTMVIFLLKADFYLYFIPPLKDKICFMNLNSISASYLRIIQIAVFTVLVMYFGQSLFIPLSFALLIALILYPVCKKLEARKIPRSLAIAIAIFIVVILFCILLWLFVWQLNFLKKDLPVIWHKIRETLLQFEQWFNLNFGAAFNLEKGWMENAIKNSGNGLSSFLQSGIRTFGSLVFSLFIIPVYHREQFVHFLTSMTPEKYHHRLKMVLHEASFAYHKYIVGLIKVYLIVGTLNSIGLLLLGVEHAILFGMLTAFMTMIPYAGIIISSLLPITVAWVSTNSIFYPLAIVAIFSFVQYLENSVIFPKVVGESLNVSTWSILVALMAGGMIWGVSGMILFMPFIAILKIVSDNIEEWKPLNILLGR
jgi:predicted PurR-regulated permease PerM